MFGDPSLAIRPLRANISSTVARSPTIAPIRAGSIAFTRAATAAKASLQLAALSLPSTRTYGLSRRCVLRPSTT